MELDRPAREPGREPVRRFRARTVLAVLIAVVVVAGTAINILAGVDGSVPVRASQVHIIANSGASVKMKIAFTD